MDFGIQVIVVHSLERSIGDPEFGSGQQTGEMIFDQASKLDNRLQPGVSGPLEPLFEVGLGSFFLKVVLKPLEFLFEVVSSAEAFNKIRKFIWYYLG